MTSRPPWLRITRPELVLLHALADLLPGPRAVKKLTNVYRMVVVGEHDRRQRYLNGEYRAAAVLAAGLIRAPWQFAA
ncbi:hypothetical protein ACFQ1S_45450, partial [Kibdelosporangium lantanae]